MVNIKELRKRTGLSQKEFSNKYNLSIRTLQQWEQGISKPLDSLVGLIEKDVNNNPDLRFKYKHSKNVYKICIDEPFLNCNKIYPIQQRKVKALIEDLRRDESVIRIVIFGSSVNDRCHIGSDIDIFYDSTNKETKLKNTYDFEYDLWNNYTVDERLMKEINKKGVIVYERNKESIR